MRIMIVNVHFAPESFGGATLVAEETAVRLTQAGHEVVVVCATGNRALSHGEMRRYEALNVPVVAIRHSGNHTIEGEYDDPVATARFHEVLDAVRPDVIHFHAIQMLGIGLVEAAQAQGIPTVVTLHDAWWLCERQFMVRANGKYCGQVAIDPDVCATCVDVPARSLARQQRSIQVLSGCARVLTPSTFWRDLMVASGVPGNITFVNANGVSRPQPGWRRAQRSGPVRFGFIGGLHPVKGYHQVVGALQSLPRTDYELKVVDATARIGGSSFDHSNWDLPGLVTVVPGYDRESIDEFFGGIDVLLFPSQWKESYGLTVREAILRGVWPIVTDGGGTVEHVRDGVTGTIIPLDGDHRALALAINEVLDAPERFLPRLGPDDDGIATLDAQAADLETHLRTVVEGG